MSASGTPRKKRRKQATRSQHVTFQVLPVQVVLADEQDGCAISHGVVLFGIDAGDQVPYPLVFPGDPALGHQLTREEAWPLLSALFGNTDVPMPTEEDAR